MTPPPAEGAEPRPGAKRPGLVLFAALSAVAAMVWLVVAWLIYLIQRGYCTDAVPPVCRGDPLPGLILACLGCALLLLGSFLVARAASRYGRAVPGQLCVAAGVTAFALWLSVPMGS